tara:strand:+ start:112 stop:288 length:177 start_codon:yes stop_codon:yes gene_type:complete
MVIAELFALSKTYPFISIIIAVVLFIIGLKITTKIFKWLLWVLSAIAIAVGIYLLFGF